MDLKTITTTLALLGLTACDSGDAKKTEVKTETEVKAATEVKTEVKDVKDVTPAAAADGKAEAKKEMACGEGKCGEGACGGSKTDGDGKAVPVDAAKGDATAPAPAPAPAPAKTIPKKS